MRSASPRDLRRNKKLRVAQEGGTFKQHKTKKPKQGKKRLRYQKR